MITFGVTLLKKMTEHMHTEDEKRGLRPSFFFAIRHVYSGTKLYIIHSGTYVLGVQHLTP